MNAAAPDDHAIHHILVVEDMETLREHLVETLGELGEGVQVDGAADGREAVAAIDSNPPYDLIFTDLTMPRMDGVALLEELQRRRVPTPVVVLTAHGQDDLIVRCMRLGASDYLVKPVGMDDLLMAARAAGRHRAGTLADLEIDYDPDGWFEVAGGSDLSVLYRFRKFLGLLSRTRIDPQVAEEVRLALEELGRNAIEWGNRFDLDKRVVFSCRILPTKIIIMITDEGEGFKPEQLPDPAADPKAHIERRQAEGKRLGGYGVHMVRHIMDKVVWNDKGNKVVAVKYLLPR